MEGKSDADSLPVLTLETKFDVPTVTSLRPGENGVLLGEGATTVSCMLERFAGSSGAAALITPAKYPDVAVEPVELVLQFHKTVHGKTPQRYTSLAFLYRLTATTPQVQQDTPLITVQPKRKSVVMGCEVLDVPEARDLYIQLTKDKPDYANIKKSITADLGEKMSSAVLECFMAKAGTSSVRMLVRVAHASRDDLLNVSGLHGVFWSPEVDRKDQFAVIWLPQAEAQDHKEAVRASKSTTQYGTVTRLDKSGDRRYGLRVIADQRDKIAQKLGKPAGMRFFVKNVPIEWVEADVLECAKQLAWDITIPNPQFATRIRRGSASWAVRASHPPSTNSAVVQTGDEKVTIQISAAEEVRPPAQRKSVEPQLKSWAAVVSAAVKTTEALVVDDRSLPKKRKSPAASSRHKSEPPAAAKAKSVTIVTPADAKPAVDENESMSTMLRTLLTQVKEMHSQMTGLGSRMTCLEGTVNDIVHGHDIDEDQDTD